MRLHKLLPNLYVSNWPDEKTLVKENFNTIITVCKKALPKELSILTNTHIHMPLTDGKDIPKGLSEVVKLVMESCISGNKTLVHCYLGKNRSYLVATLAYAYLMRISRAKALEVVRGIYPGALKNKVFEKYMAS